MSIAVKQFVTGPIETNTYVVSNEKKACCIIDPSSGCDEVLRFVKGDAMLPEAVILTHCHFDHILGIPEVIRQFPDISIWAHPMDRQLLTRADKNGSRMIGCDYAYNGPVNDLQEGDMTIGSFACTVLYIPGHTPGGCALLFDDHCFSGDSLFPGSIGRCDFEYSDESLLIQSINKKFMTLPDNTIVHPGHMGRTTIGREKRMNPFLS